MKEEFSFYVGVDWGVEFHQACILDANGETICQRRIEHSGAGMLEFCDFLQGLTNGEASALTTLPLDVDKMVGSPFSSTTAHKI